jgi:hypothetical protein
MDIWNKLRDLGDRLGIVELAPARPGGAPARIETRAVTLAELMAEIRSGEIRALADSPADPAAPLDRVFESAGVAPPAHGWTALRLARLAESEELRGLDRGALREKLLERMRADGADARDVVRDAVARDRALDEFERSAGESAHRRWQAAERRLAELDERIRDLEAQRARLAEQVTAEKARWSEWLRQKRHYEKELAAGVGYLISERVVTVDGGEE